MNDLFYFIGILIMAGMVGLTIIVLIIAVKRLIDTIVSNIRTDRQIKEWEEDQKRIEKSGRSNLMNMY